MKRKYLALAIIAVLGSTSIVVAQLLLNLSFDMEFVSLGDALILVDDIGTPVLQLGPYELFIGQTEAVTFQLINAYNGPLTVEILPTLPTGYSFPDGEFGMRLDGSGDILPLAFSTPTIIPEGSYLELWLGIIHDSPATPPELGTLEVTVNG